MIGRECSSIEKPQPPEPQNFVEGRRFFFLVMHIRAGDTTRRLIVHQLGGQLSNVFRLMDVLRR